MIIERMEIVDPDIIRKAAGQIMEWFWSLSPDARNGSEFLTFPEGDMDVADELVLAAHHGDKEFCLLSLLLDDATVNDTDGHVATLRELLGSMFRVSRSLQGRYVLDVWCDIRPSHPAQSTATIEDMKNAEYNLDRACDLIQSAISILPDAGLGLGVAAEYAAQAAWQVRKLIKAKKAGDTSASTTTTHLYPSWDAVCEAIDNACKVNTAGGNPETRFTLSIDAETDCYVLTVG